MSMAGGHECKVLVYWKCVVMLRFISKTEVVVRFIGVCMGLSVMLNALGLIRGNIKLKVGEKWYHACKFCLLLPIR